VNCIHVTTQAALDEALAAGGSPCIHIEGDGEFEVSASGSATVSAYDSATVRAYGSATVSAYDSATVRAGAFTAVHKLGQAVTVTGPGHVITPPNLEGADAQTWLSYHGIEPNEDGIVTLYKAVSDGYTTDRKFDYSPGSTPEAPDWEDDHECGGGLHFSPTPVHAMAFYYAATKFMACPVRLDEISVIDQQKIKARRVVEPGCREVDIDGQPLIAPAAAVTGE
jgi:hypothetical protein